MSKLIEKVRHEIVVIGGVVVTVGEAVLQVLPAGSVTTTLQVALPILAAVVVRAKTLPLSKFEQVVAQLARDLRPKAKAVIAPASPSLSQPPPSPPPSTAA
jgi:hypothetical protein